MVSIIVVDDQASNRRIMTKLAASVAEDVEVMAFGDPLQALDYVESHTPDLLITDFKMQPIDGDEFIRRFRQVPACAQVPAVVVTSYQDIEFRDRALRAGSTDFLLSPFDYQDFRKRSRSLLSRSQQVDTAVNSRAERAAASATLEMLNAMLLEVNNHLATALADLDFARSDLKALMEVTEVAAVFVDAAMQLRDYTPAATSLFSLSPHDVGRPLTAIAGNLVVADLPADFRRACETGRPLEKYVHSHDGHAHYRMTVNPCRSKSGNVTGALITFTRVGASYSGRG